MSQLASIARAFWWRNPFQHAFFLIALVLGLGTMSLANQSLSPSAINIICMATLFVPCMLLLVIYTFGGDLDLTSRTSGFPKWWLTLPIRSWLLACYPVAALALGAAGTWLLWRYAFEMTFKEKSDLPIVVPAILFVGIGSWIQAITWRPAFHPMIRIVVLICFPIVTDLLVSILYVFFSGQLASQIALTTTYAVLGIAAAVLAVDSNRLAEPSKTFLSIQHWWRSNTLSRASKGSPTAFFDQQSSLCWRDRVQLGQWLAAGAMLLVTLMYVLMWINPNKGLILAICLMPLIWFTAFSSHSGKTAFFKGKCQLPTYLGVLPIQTKELVWARYRSLLESIGFVYVLVLLMLAFWFLSHPSTLYDWMLDFENRQGVWYTLRNAIVFAVTILFITYCAAGKYSWLSYSGRPLLEGTVVTCVYTAGILFMVYVVQQTSFLIEYKKFDALMSQSRDYAPIAIGVAILLKLVLAFSAWRFAFKRGLVNGSDLAWWCRTSGTIAIAVIMILIVAVPRRSVTPTEITLFVLMLIPIASPAINVLALDFNRHR